MVGRALSRHAYLALKAATKRLIEACGGVEGAAFDTRVGKSQLSDYASPFHEKSFVPADVIADLERFTGAPFVTRALAAITGHQLIKLPEAAPVTGPYTVRELAAVTRQTSQLVSGIAEALADDGQVSRGEVSKLKLIEDHDRAIELLCESRSALERIRDREEGGDD
jgi:hypothetical protein